MVEYLQGLLDGHEHGIEVEALFEGDRHFDTHSLLAVDSTGIVTKGKKSTTFRPWRMVQFVRVAN
jgi:hypothetical protein